MVRKDGITAAILHGGRVLLLKRRSIPFILNPGIWAFLSGGRKEGERYIDTAYREIGEEVGIGKQDLRLLYSGKALMADRKRGIMWPNAFFIFGSNTGRIRLDYENSKYRWGTMKEIKTEVRYTNIFINRKSILREIRCCLDRSENPEGEAGKGLRQRRRR